MFIAGRVFEKPEEAKTWVEAHTSADERRFWYVVQLLDEDLKKTPLTWRNVQGLNPDGKLVR